MFKNLSQDCVAFLYGVKSVQSLNPSLGLALSNSLRLALISKTGIVLP